jgi:ATP-dependent Clp protease adaptor protein ClpS
MNKEKELHDQKKLNSNIYTLVVWNDNFNTFDHVINCLIKYCEHTLEQAQQCTISIHYKGKSDVKRGNEKTLLSIWNRLTENNITATIEV